MKTFDYSQTDAMEALVDQALEMVEDRYEDFYEWENMSPRSKFLEVATALHQAYAGNTFISAFKRLGLDFNGYDENFYMYTAIGKEVQFKAWKSLLKASHGDKKQ